MRERFLTCGATVLAILALAPGAASAAADGGTGGARPPVSQRAGRVAVTEDSDADGVPNCPDPVGDRDNRHPSGRDRHCESGASGNQGSAASDPDGTTNGGVDKPGGLGGVDTFDQDGNNGCGNDDDFEDDNRGRCLGRERHVTPAPQTAAQVQAAQVRAVQRRRQWERANPLAAETQVETQAETQVLGVTYSKAPSARQADAGSPTVVAGTSSQAPPLVVPVQAGADAGVAGASRQTPSVPAGALPFTGLALLRLVALAAVLIGFGVAARRLSRLGSSVDQG